MCPRHVPLRCFDSTENSISEGEPMSLRFLRSLILGASLLSIVQIGHALQVGDIAPDFSLPSTGSSGNSRLSDFVGKKSVVIFTYNGAFQRI